MIIENSNGCYWIFDAFCAQQLPLLNKLVIFEIFIIWNRMLNYVRLVESHYSDNLGNSNLLQLNRIYLDIFYE